MIEIRGVTKRYGRRTVLEDVHLSAAPGRVTGFLGLNGAGKSTTLRVLLGLARADTGEALVDGVPYRRLAQPLRTVGAMVDGAGPAPERRGVDHLWWIAQTHRIPRRRVDEVLEVVGLAHAARRRVGRYSLGMRQRLGLAAAMLGEPRVLVLDEPVNGLDPDGVRTLRTFLREHAAHGGTVLLSSHLMAEAELTVDDVVVLDRGRVVASGTLAEVTARHGSLERAFLALTDAPARW